MGILVQGFDDNDPQPRTAIIFLTHLAGIIDGTIDVEALTPEQIVDLTTTAKILNKYDDLSLPRIAIRSHIGSMTPLDALLQYSQALRNTMLEEFEAVRQQVRALLAITV